MKTILLLLLLLSAPLAAVAQGKVSFVNDSNHLYRWDPDGMLLAADTALAGQPISGVPPSGVTLIAGLYAGTSITSLTLQTSTTALTGTGLASPGIQAGRPTVLTVPGGVPQWFRILIWDSALPPPPDANDPLNGWSGTYLGWSMLFQATPGTSFTYPSIMPGGPANSTLLPFPIDVPGMPEPSVAAIILIGLGQILLHCRRRTSG